MKSHILFIVLSVFCFFSTSCGQKQNSTPNTSHNSLSARKVNVILFENFPEARAKHFVTELRKVIPVVEITKVHEKLPASAWYAPRSRYLAIKLLDYMKTVTPDGAISLGLTTKDISQMRGETDWGIMGLSYKPGKTVVGSKPKKMTPALSNSRRKNNIREEIK